MQAKISSGKCYLSLHSHFASANRGACIQNCRRSYVVTDKEDGMEFEIDNEFIMSAKDLCTIDFLDKILDAGVSVLKLEGRGRSVDYVHTVTKCYTEAIDAYLEGTYTKGKTENWKMQLATVFNRVFGMVIIWVVKWVSGVMKTGLNLQRKKYT